MPTIPNYLTPQVAPSAAPTVYDKTDTRGTHGEQLAEVVKGAGEMVAKIAQEEKAKADTAAILQAESDYRRTLNGLWADPEKGLSNFKGAEFAGKDVEALKVAKDVRGKILGGLRNDTQRQEFQRRADSHAMAFEEQVGRYSLQQRDLNLKQSADNSIKEALDEVALHALDLGPDGKPDTNAMLKALGGMDEVAAVQARLTGQDPKRIEKEIAAQAAMLVLDANIDAGRAGQMREFFEDNKEALGVHAGKYEKVLRGGSIKDAGRTEADRIYLKANGDPVKMAGLARGIKDTELFDEVGRRIKQRVSEDHAMRQASDSPKESRLEIGIYRGSGLDRNSADYLTLSPEGAARVESKLKAAQLADSREQRERDLFLKSVYDATPIKDRVGIKIDQSRVFSGMSPTARNNLKATQQTEVKEYEKDMGVGLQDFETQVKDLATKRGYEKKKAAAFLTHLKTKRAVMAQDNQRPPTAAEVRALLADAVLEGDYSQPGDIVPHALSPNREKWEAEAEGRAGDFATFAPEEQEYLKLIDGLNAGAPGDLAKATEGASVDKQAAPKSKVWPVGFEKKDKNGIWYVNKGNDANGKANWQRINK